MTAKDARLKIAAVATLLSGTGTPPGVISADVEDGWILLSGEVDYRFQQQAAAAQLSGLHDACGVRNGVTIRPGSGRTIWDDFLGRYQVCGTDDRHITLSQLTLAPCQPDPLLAPLSSRTLS